MQSFKTKVVVYRIFFVAAIVFLLCATTYPQSTPAVSGRWVWKQIARKNKPQKQFTVTIELKRDVITGVYSVDEFINGKWQGEDGNQTPFLGELKGTTARIKFDPAATVPGYEQNVIYQNPTDGREPGTATLIFTRRTLLWRQDKGPGIEGLPGKLMLRRERTKQKASK